jgi:hypothetical protein
MIATESPKGLRRYVDVQWVARGLGLAAFVRDHVGGALVFVRDQGSVLCTGSGRRRI